MATDASRVVTVALVSAVNHACCPHAEPEHGCHCAPRNHHAASSLSCTTAFTNSPAPRLLALPLPTSHAVAAGIRRNRPVAALPATTGASGTQLGCKKWRGKVGI
ncbi:hypothetical protein PVAP13_1KG137705 [Panicum virgatum]|uniref:Uncharacterized protein n=1 Tax=Panicum virgatum TaxID=38727 RepID=A0A8T0XQU0_PANVG|nr:hypothetical protein PVAP13_1KG137705 [Panicum virgatum]